jgi:hypothetical protein
MVAYAMHAGVTTAGPSFLFCGPTVVSTEIKTSRQRAQVVTLTRGKGGEMRYSAQAIMALQDVDETKKKGLTDVFCIYNKKS